MTVDKIACVILASGLSERFGAADKIAADLCGQSMLSRILKTAKAVGFGQIFCVVQPGSHLDETDIAWIENTNPEAGQGHALRLGLGAAKKSGWENVAILLGDMPLVSGAYLKTMASKYDEKQSLISKTESTRLPPAIFNSAAISKILSQDITAGARDIFDQIDLVTVPIYAEAALDVDTPADLARVERIMKARRK